MCAFKKMLKEYLMVENMKQAEAWVKKQPCGPNKSRNFLAECHMALGGEDHWMTYEEAQDYVDYLRVNRYDGTTL